jgi:hypothetical protein
MAWGNWGNAGQGAAMGGPYGQAIGAVAGSRMSPWSTQNMYEQGMYGQAQDFYGQQPNAEMRGLEYGMSGADLGPWGASIGETPDEVAARANPTQPTSPVNDVNTNLTDIYNKIAGNPADQTTTNRYNPETGNVIGGNQIADNTQLPYLEQQYGQAQNFYNQGQQNPMAGQGTYGSLMKALRGNRIGAIMGQYGMPRRGGNALGTAGQGAAMGANKAMMGNAWGMAGQGAAKGAQNMMGPWGQQQGLLGNLYGAYGAGMGGVGAYGATPYSGGGQ